MLRSFQLGKSFLSRIFRGGRCKLIGTNTLGYPGCTQWPRLQAQAKGEESRLPKARSDPRAPSREGEQQDAPGKSCLSAQSCGWGTVKSVVPCHTELSYSIFRRSTAEFVIKHCRYSRLATTALLAVTPSHHRRAHRQAHLTCSSHSVLPVFPAQPPSLPGNDKLCLNHQDENRISYASHTCKNVFNVTELINDNTAETVEQHFHGDRSPFVESLGCK